MLRPKRYGHINGRMAWITCRLHGLFDTCQNMEDANTSVVSHLLKPCGDVGRVITLGTNQVERDKTPSLAFAGAVTAGTSVLLPYSPVVQGQDQTDKQFLQKYYVYFTDTTESYMVRDLLPTTTTNQYITVWFSSISSAESINF